MDVSDSDTRGHALRGHLTQICLWTHSTGLSDLDMHTNTQHKDRPLHLQQRRS